jgi:hypothetical protein
MSINETILKPVVSGKKSNYGRAKIIECDGVKYLKSYQTIVCVIDSDNNFIRLWDKYSVTTQTHINDFRAVFGFPAINKKEWNSLEVVEGYKIPVEVSAVPMKYKSNYYVNDIYNPFT